MIIRVCYRPTNVSEMTEDNREDCMHLTSNMLQSLHIQQEIEESNNNFDDEWVDAYHHT